MSIALPWSDFKAYVAAVGPGRGRLARPAQCVFCDGDRVWFNGWRRVLVTLLVDGQPHRLTDWLPLQRVRCAQPPCGRSWTLRPPCLYPHRSLEPDLAEAAALAYLAEPQATYRAVAQRVGCSWGAVWLWIGWLATLVTPATVLARVARLRRRSGLGCDLQWGPGDSLPLSLFSEPSPERGDIEDRDPPHLAEGQEVGVGADQVVGTAGHRTLEELVVGGIPAHADHDLGTDEEGPAPDTKQHRAGLAVTAGGGRWYLLPAK